MTATVERCEDRTLLTLFSGTNFASANFGQSGGFIPPDMQGAAGPTQLVEAANGSFTVFSKSGATISQVSLDSFFNTALAAGGGGTVSGYSFDPRVLYDEQSQRFFVAGDDNANKANSFIIAVSNSSDATGGWKAWKVAADPTGLSWMDYPTLGVNHDGVYLAGNMFPISSGSSYTDILVIPKADLLSGAGVANKTLFANLNANTTGYTVHPVTNLNSAQGQPELFLSDYNTPGGKIKLTVVSGTVTAPTLVTSPSMGDTTSSGGFITVPARGNPDPPPQLGDSHTFDPGDTRFGSSVVEQGTNLWAVQAVDISGRAGIAWYRIDATSGNLLEQGTIASSTNSYFYPSIAVNGSGEIVIGFSGSSPSIYAGAFAVTGLFNGTSTSFGSVQEVQLGTGPYFIDYGSGRNRWGDYSAVALDPTDHHTFWSLQEWASTPAGQTTSSSAWSTQFTAFGLAQTVTNVSSTTANGTYGVGASVAITVTFSDAVVVTGTPKLKLNSGGTASYTSGSGTNTLTFAYTVGATDAANPLDVQSTTALDANGGTIKDATSGVPAALAVPAPGTAGSLGVNKAIIIGSSVAAGVTGVRATNTAGTYGAGAVITIKVAFSNPVTVTGTPLLALNSSGTAAYSSGSGTNTLTFTYTVGTGEAANPLDDASTTALTLNGGTINDSGSNPATLTLPAPGTASSLSQSGIIINAVVAVTGVTATNPAGTYGFGAVITVDVAFGQSVVVTGTPQLALNSGGTAAYASGSGTSTLVFTYNVGANQSANPLDEASATALTLNGGTIKDTGGHAASLTLPAPGAAGSLSKSQIAVSTAPTLGVNVTGLTINDVSSLNSGQGTAPPDTAGAVGLNHIVEFVNGAFAIYKKSDGSLVSKVSDTSFWTSTVGLTVSTAGLSNPRVLFDPFTQHWFAIEITNDSTANHVLLARSDTADPTGTWHGTQFTADAGYGDFPTLGLDQAAVYIGVNDFASSSNPTYLGQSIFSVPKADLLLATPSLARMTTFADLSPNVGFTLQPAVNFGAYTGNGMLLGVDNSAFGKIDRTDVLNGGAAAATLSATTQIAVQTTSYPPAASQPDGTVVIDTSDDRISASVYAAGNRLYMAHTITVSGRAAVRWTVIDYTNNSVVGEGTISDPNYDYFNPSIAANQFGEAVIVFNRSGTGTSDFIGSYAIFGATTNGVLGFTQPTLLKAGQANYHLFNSNPEPWGDYSSVSVDPTNPHTFWTFQEYAQPSNVWATQVTQIAFPDTSIPTVTFVGAQPSTGDFKAGQSVTVVVNFNEPITVTGTPTIALNSGGTATYTSGSGTSQLLFTYTVGAGNNSTRLDYTSTTALALNGGTIRDPGNNAAVLTLAAPGAQASLGYDTNIVIDTTAPAVTSVTSTTANGTYTSGNTITITIGFTEPVTVTGTPQLALNSGGTASYASGTGTSTLSFTYTVGATDNSAHLDYAAVTALGLNSGTIVDGATNPAALTLPAPGAAGSLGANKNLVVYNTALVMDNGDETYHETGLWGPDPAAGYGGSNRYAAAGDGSTTATWQVTGLATGDYDVQVTWRAYSNRATNAPYRIYDGTTLLQTVRVNQQAAPAGTMVGGVAFQRIATVHVASGTLKIVLGNDANGYVIADAVRLGPASTAIDLNWTGGGITGPTSIATDTNFTISRTYQISGAAPTSDFTIVYYASPDSTFGTSNQVLLGSETITASADKTVGSHTGTSPAFQLHGGGTYYLYAVLDGGGTVTETDETNNVAQTAQTAAASGAMVVDNGAAGYSETGAWGTDPASGYGGSNRYAAAGDGSTTATWQVTGLATGNYDVQVSWVSYSNRATNAPYRIYDGTTLLQTVRVNQQGSPAGTVIGGVAFQRIATVPVSSGTLKVVLGNDANGYVIADAVRLGPASTAIDLNWTGGGITGPTSIATDTNFTISRTYQISGAAPTSDFTIVYYASPDNTFGTSNQVLLGSETITAAADKTVGSHTGTSPAFQLHGAGTYYLYAVLDSGNAVAETDETNNVAQASQQVVASGALVIDNGTAGYSETGTWSSATDSGFDSNYRYASSGNGQTTATATWQATGLATGDYDLQVTWSAVPNRASNAPYQVYDGATLLGTVVVNQQMAPVGLAYGGVTFQRIGTFHITSGTLKVVLGNNANGYVIADAARIAVSPAPTIDLNWTGGGVTAPSTATTDATFTVSRTYQITGGAPSTDFTIAYYASTDNTFGNADDVLIGTETITAAADKTVGTHAGTSPALQIRLPGTYTIFAKVDAIDAVRETDETNNVAQAAPPVAVSGASFVDNVDAGYSETGTWYGVGATTGGYNGSYRYAPAGTGNSTARWQVGGLTNAVNYEVDVTWMAYANRATNATYSVYDGATLLGSVVVDQTKVPSGTSYTGVPFLSLGATYKTTSGALTVVLTDNANSWVIADAVRVALAGSAPALAASPSGTAASTSAAPAPQGAPSSPLLVDTALAQWQPASTLTPSSARAPSSPVVAATETVGLVPVPSVVDTLPLLGGPLAGRKKR